LQAELQQQRKTLRVALGASAPPPPPQQQQGAAAGGQQSQQQQQQQEGHANGGGSSLAESVKANPVISKYFTVRIARLPGYLPLLPFFL
jgi:hypothetical protein